MTLMETQRRELVGALVDLYGNGDWIRPTRFSNGRGGFNAATVKQTVRCHREASREETVKRNIAPGNALIYVLNDDSIVAPLKGDGLSYDGQAYMITEVAQDPLGVAYECECEHGGPSESKTR